MEQQPKKLLTRILEFAVVLALSAFLIRLATKYLLDAWPVLLVVGVVAIAAVVIYRLLKWKNGERW